MLNNVTRWMLIFATLLLAIPCTAQNSFEEYKKQRSQDFNNYRNARQKEFEEYRRKRNEEFAEYLRKAWGHYEPKPTISKPKEKPQPPVINKDKDRPIEDKPIVIEEEIKVPKPKPQPQPIVPIEETPPPIDEKPTVPQPAIETLNFSFYGTKIKVRAGKEQRFKLASANEESVAKAWTELSSPAYNNLIVDCLELRKRLKLCDWAYLRMIDTMSSTLLGNGTNEAELLKAFVFCQSGYQMRLAFESGKLRMLYASEYRIFEKPCWDVDGVLFYADNIRADRISICKAKFPHEQAMSLAVTEEQRLSPKPSQERTLVSEDRAWMSATVTEDENLMSFCNDYPSSYFGDDFMTRWALYANTPMSRMAKDKLYPQLREWVKDKGSAEAVDILCHWVQTAFVYEYDDKVWGGDRAFFADETLYYPYCDCEDRSILLTRIVRDLLGLKCALVYYPGHLATAIAVGEDARGDYIRIGGVKYIVCDPTYIGAPIGRTMPGMDNQSAKVIVLE